MFRKLTALLLIAACPVPAYYSMPDGCSGGTAGAKAKFKSQCTNHDICYRVGPSRKSCDRAFFNDMLRTCFPGYCAQALIMYVAVSANPRGQEIFDNRHRNQSKYVQQQCGKK